MKLFKLLNPQGWLGQLLLLSLFGTTVLFFGMYLGTKNCPPVTQVQIDQKNKVKKSGRMNNDVTGLTTSADCEKWLRGLDMKEIKRIWKSN